MNHVPEHKVAARLAQYGGAFKIVEMLLNQFDLMIVWDAP